MNSIGIRRKLSEYPRTIAARQAMKPRSSAASYQMHLFCPTSKMSHDHGRRDSCWLRLLSPWVHSIRLSLARGMTDVGVGSGALFGFWFVQVRNPPRMHAAPTAEACRKHAGSIGRGFLMGPR